MADTYAINGRPVSVTAYVDYLATLPRVTVHWSYTESEGK